MPSNEEASITNVQNIDDSELSTSAQESLCNMCAIALDQDPFAVRFTDKQALREGLIDAINSGLIKVEDVEVLRRVMAHPCIIVGQFVYERMSGTTEHMIQEVAKRSNFTQEQIAGYLIGTFGSGENDEDVIFKEYCKFSQKERTELFSAVFNYHIGAILDFLKEH
ncbi:hypothetical protein KC678_02210 [Candidatus Dojkabacteria bacterium]|uniref:Uncharacterized protein n=1 Tax=Candidatus Dojkabacteria bacterium TaxID=2099670 RepID=A0A955ICK8_9BACT|nr:hypothetical protein [Candidatus Dojkabacteria bacterium]